MCFLPSRYFPEFEIVLSHNSTQFTEQAPSGASPLRSEAPRRGAWKNLPCGGGYPHSCKPERRNFRSATVTPRWRSYGIECLEVQFVDLWTCVVLRFVFFVARYLNYIEQRCCISDTVRSIGWLVALLSKSAGKNKAIIAAGVLFFFGARVRKLRFLRW